MLERILTLGLLAALLDAPGWSQENDTAASTAEAPPRPWTFDTEASLDGLTRAGAVTIDRTMGRGDSGGALAVAPRGKVVWELSDHDASGTVDLWVYDDGTRPTNAKEHRPGPRWGLVQRDGRVFAVGILYASYLGGSEGYTAAACDGKSWFERLVWLGVKRAPAGWHKWTFDFDARSGLRVLHDHREVTAVDPDKTGLDGFCAVAIWGDDGKRAGDADKGQTLWVDDLSIVPGGPVEPFTPPGERDPYDSRSIAEDPSVRDTLTVYTEDNAPETPGLEDLPLRESLTQHGITWRFAEAARAGRFVGGDWCVVGPVKVEAIEPRPLYGSDIPRRQLDRMDRERPVSQRVRNGFMLNPPARMKVAYDSGVRNYFDPSLVQKLPVTMSPGDALVSTISMPKGLVLHAPLRNKIERGQGDSSPIRTAAVLTCVGEPQPADAFRPAFCDRTQRIYLARELRRGRLPTVESPASRPPAQLYARFTQRPWVGTCFFGFEEPVENMPQYGLEYGRVAGIAALLLCTDLEPERKEPLLVNYVQVGLDLAGMVRAGHPGWTCWGGHGSGRKLPIVFAGLLLGDDQLARVSESFPRVSFGEDEQTAYGACWTGAQVVFTGHSGIDTVTGSGRSRGNGWGPYEHMHPSDWRDGQNTSESYRRCCTSVGWRARELIGGILGSFRLGERELAGPRSYRKLRRELDAAIDDLR